MSSWLAPSHSHATTLVNSGPGEITSRKRRTDLGLLQRDVASRLKVNEATVCNWETNRTSPQLRFIPRIIAFLGYCPYCPQSEQLGKRFISHSSTQRLRQTDLALRPGIDPSTPGRWERGQSAPSKNLLRKLNAFLTSHPSDQNPISSTE